MKASVQMWLDGTELKAPEATLNKNAGEIYTNSGSCNWGPYGESICKRFKGITRVKKNGHLKSFHVSLVETTTVGQHTTIPTFHMMVPVHQKQHYKRVKNTITIGLPSLTTHMISILKN